MFRVYVAGPLTRCGEDAAVGARVHLNAQIALATGADLICKGYNPYVPHYNLLMQDLMNSAGPDYNGWLDMDYEWLSHCHALLRLPGESPGADKEVEFAKDHRIPVVHSVEALDELHDVWLHKSDLIHDPGFLALWHDKKPGVEAVIRKPGTLGPSWDVLDRQCAEREAELAATAKKEQDRHALVEKLTGSLKREHPGVQVKVTEGGMIQVSLA